MDSFLLGTNWMAQESYNHTCYTQVHTDLYDQEYGPNIEKPHCQSFLKIKQ